MWTFVQNFVDHFFENALFRLRRGSENLILIEKYIRGLTISSINPIFGILICNLQLLFFKTEKHISRRARKQRDVQYISFNPAPQIYNPPSERFLFSHPLHPPPLWGGQYPHPRTSPHLTLMSRVM